MKVGIVVKIRRAFWRTMPEQIRARHYLRRFDRSYELEIRAARQKGEHQKAEMLAQEHFALRRDEQREVDRLETGYWYRQANRYHVPMPPHSDSNAWERDEQEGRSYLTNAGIHEVEKLIREKQKWRQDRWVGWVGLLVSILVALSGLVGTLIGLASVWSHHKSN